MSKKSLIFFFKNVGEGNFCNIIPEYNTAKKMVFCALEAFRVHHVAAWALGPLSPKFGLLFNSSNNTLIFNNLFFFYNYDTPLCNFIVMIIINAITLCVYNKIKNDQRFNCIRNKIFNS